MNEKERIQARLNEKSKMGRAQRHMMKLFVVSSSIIFLTLLYVWIRQVQPKMDVPNIYFLGSILVMLGSLGLYLVQKAIVKNQLKKASRLMKLSMTMGVLFVVTQFLGWQDLIDSNQVYKNILLPFSFIHFLHVVIALLFLFLVFVRLRNYQIHSKALGFSSNVFYFWHFLGFIWLSFIGLMA